MGGLAADYHEGLLILPAPYRQISGKLDLFGKGRHIYTFENICKEDKDIAPGDETTKIFLNTDSEQEDVSKGLRAFLDYVRGKNSEDPFIRKLDKAVKEAKKNREWRREYMTLLMRDQENIEKGIAKGMVIMIENALQTIKSVRQTAAILKVSEEMVRGVAEDKGLAVED